MPRRYKYRRNYGGRDKYSIEQAAGILNTTNGAGAVIVVPSVSFQGMRKVMHITVSLATGSTGGSGLVYWALVYVPAGTSPNQLNVSGETLYEPNQYVMNAGIFDPETGPGRVSSPLARNLNSGDAVYLVVSHSTNSYNGNFNYMARYAVTLQ